VARGSIERVAQAFNAPPGIEKKEKEKKEVE
jgi:hypothetical protein